MRPESAKEQDRRKSDQRSPGLGIVSSGLETRFGVLRKSPHEQHAGLLQERIYLSFSQWLLK